MSQPTFDYECAYCGGEGNADERCSGMMIEPDHPASVEMVPKGTNPGPGCKVCGDERILMEPDGSKAQPCYACQPTRQAAADRRIESAGA
jgi:hypothetical protein